MTPTDALVDELRALRVRAGRPSFRRLARHDGRAFAASTIADTLNGRRKSVAWPFVHFFVTGCVAHAERYTITLPPADADLQHWWRLWLGTAAATAEPTR